MELGEIACKGWKGSYVSESKKLFHLYGLWVWQEESGSTALPSFLVTCPSAGCQEKALLKGTF